MVRVNKLWYICTIKYKRNANLDSHVHRDGQMSKPKLTKSQMEDTKQLCSTLRMRSCMSSLRLRPSLWYQMRVSDACKMALWPGSALRRGYSLFLLGVLKRGRWEACSPVRLFPRNSETMVRDIHMVIWLVVPLWTAWGLIFTQLCVHALSSELGLVRACLPMRTVRSGELKWLVSLVEDRSQIQWIRWMNSNTSQSLPTVPSLCLMFQACHHQKLRATFSHSTNIFWAPIVYRARCWGHSSEQDLPFHFSVWTLKTQNGI